MAVEPDLAPIWERAIQSTLSRRRSPESRRIAEYVIRAFVEWCRREQILPWEVTPVRARQYQAILGKHPNNPLSTLNTLHVEFSRICAATGLSIPDSPFSPEECPRAPATGSRSRKRTRFREFEKVIRLAIETEDSDSPKTRLAVFLIVYAYIKDNIPIEDALELRLGNLQHACGSIHVCLPHLVVPLPAWATEPVAAALFRLEDHSELAYILPRKKGEQRVPIQLSTLRRRLAEHFPKSFRLNRLRHMKVEDAPPPKTLPREQPTHPETDSDQVAIVADAERRARLAAMRKASDEQRAERVREMEDHITASVIERTAEAELRRRAALEQEERKRLANAEKARLEAERKNIPNGVLPTVGWEQRSDHINFTGNVQPIPSDVQQDMMRAFRCMVGSLYLQDALDAYRAGEAESRFPEQAFARVAYGYTGTPQSIPSTVPFPTVDDEIYREVWLVCSAEHREQERQRQEQQKQKHERRLQRQRKDRQALLTERYGDLQGWHPTEDNGVDFSGEEALPDELVGRIVHIVRAARLDSPQAWRRRVIGDARTAPSNDQGRDYLFLFWRIVTACTEREERVGAAAPWINSRQHIADAWKALHPVGEKSYTEWRAKVEQEHRSWQITKLAAGLGKYANEPLTRGWKAKRTKPNTRIATYELMGENSIRTGQLEGIHRVLETATTEDDAKEWARGFGILAVSDGHKPNQIRRLEDNRRPVFYRVLMLCRHRPRGFDPRSFGSEACVPLEHIQKAHKLIRMIYDQLGRSTPNWDFVEHDGPFSRGVQQA